MDYTVSDGDIEEGDFAINTLEKSPNPKLVSKNEYGYLGFYQSGWFSWMPVSNRHKKVLLNQSGESL